MPDKTFIYHQNHPYKVFPIDYYMRDFEPQKRRNTARAEKLAEHPYIKEVLTDLIWMKDQPNQDYGYENGGRHPFPVEAETLLRCFSELLERPEYHDADRERLEEDAFKRRFSADLCMSIAESIFSYDKAKQYDDAAYCRHTLCENDSFCHTLVRGLWKRELGDRLAQIEQLAADVHPTLQAVILQDVLLTLDKACFNLIRWKKHKKARHKPPTPNELLEKLVSKRNKVTKSPPKDTPSEKRAKKAVSCKRSAVYRVKNAVFEVPEDNDVTQTDLKAAFKALEDPAHPKPALMKQARLAYLETLENEVQELPFEQKYLELRRYIDVVSKPLSQSAVRQIVTDTIKRRGQGEIDCMLQTLRKREEYQFSAPRSYLDRLLYDAAQFRVTQSMRYFQEVRQLIGDFYALSKTVAAMEQRTLGLGNEAGEHGSENVRMICCCHRKSYFVKLQEMFCRYWVHTDGRSPVDEYGHFTELQRIAAKFVRRANDTAQYFDIDKALLCSESEMQILLKMCEDYAVGEDAVMPASEIADISFTILITAMLQILHHLAQEEIRGLVADFKVFRAVQRPQQFGGRQGDYP